MIRTIEDISTVRDGKSRTFWFGFFFFAIIVSATVLLSIARSNHRAGVEVCSLIRENYFRSGDVEVRSFLDRCDREARLAPLTLSRKQAIDRINRTLKGLKTSHLSVYTPVENRQIWANEGVDTGLRARRVEGEIIIYQLIDDGPGERAGVRPGDAVVSVNGAEVDEDDVESTPGEYKIARGSKIFSVEIGVEDIAEDLGPKLVSFPKGIGYLRIASFLPQYFSEGRWSPIAGSLRKHTSLVIDVRGNAGGSFPGMLRALSPLFCRSTVVGELWTTAEGVERGEPTALPDDLRASVQLEVLQASGGLVRLKTFEGYGCFDRPVVLLVDDETSSVSEIFADALSTRERTRVWGIPTAGQVVMARWFEIGSLGGGDFAMSIPVAGFRTPDAREIESEGLLPKKILVYDLEAALAGEDNWLSEASRALESGLSSGVSPGVSK